MAPAWLHFCNLHESLSSPLYCEFLDSRDCDLLIFEHSINTLIDCLFFTYAEKLQWLLETLKGIITLKWGKYLRLLTSTIQQNVSKKKETSSNKLRMTYYSLRNSKQGKSSVLNANLIPQGLLIDSYFFKLIDLFLFLQIGKVLIRKMNTNLKYSTEITYSLHQKLSLK